MSGTDLGHEGSFVWLTTGLPLIYKNFLKHQPDNARGNEHCLELHGNGQWNDAPCTYNYFSVCQFWNALYFSHSEIFKLKNNKLHVDHVFKIIPIKMLIKYFYWYKSNNKLKNII